MPEFDPSPNSPKSDMSVARLSIFAALVAIAIGPLVYATRAEMTLLMLVPASAILGIYFGISARNEKGHELQARAGILLNALVLFIAVMILFELMTGLRAH